MLRSMKNLQTKPFIALIAEDDAVVRVLLRNILKQKGCQCIEAADGKQAEEIFQVNQKAISFVFLDIQMPLQDGIQTLKKMRELDSGVPIYILTGQADRQTLKKCMSHKIDGFFPKPFDFSRIESTLYKKFPELENASPAKAKSAKKKASTKGEKEISLDQKLLNNRIKREVESVLALNRKLLQFLPHLTAQRLQEYSDEQKVISRSETYRSMRFALNSSNVDIVVGCLKNLPSQHRIGGALNFSEPRIFIPVIGEILSENFDGIDPGVLHECVESALSDLKTISNFEQVMFDHKLFIEKERNKAVFLHHPYKVEFLITQGKEGKRGYEFQLEKADLAE